jgi:protein-L-isoaspartate(D-aspartate) O-methyltransferase
MEMNFEVARHNMIEQQIRPWDILDQSCLAIMEEVPREEFVPEALKQLAFSDIELALGHGQLMLAPKIEAKILQAIQVQASDKVLEIGTGSGYLTALLATKADSVHSIDIYQDFLDSAQQTTQSLELQNISFENADLYNYNLVDKKYDVIVVGGSVTAIPENLKQSLNDGGRLFIVCGKAPLMYANLLTRVDSNQWMEEILFETEIPTLENSPEKSEFVF